MQLHDQLGTAVQVAGAAVVAQPAPQAHDLITAGGGQIRHRGAAGQKAVEVADDGGHLRLLQHDFGQPDAVRVLGVLPGQAVAAVLRLPAHHGGGETALRHAQTSSTSIWVLDLALRCAATK